MARHLPPSLWSPVAYSMGMSTSTAVAMCYKTRLSACADFGGVALTSKQINTLPPVNIRALGRLLRYARP